MFRRFSADFALFSIVMDALMTAFGLRLAQLLRPLFNRWEFVREINEIPGLPTMLFVVFPAVWVGVLLLFSVYDGRRNLRVADEFGSLTLGALLAMISMAGILYLSYREISRFLFALFVLLAYLLMLLWRSVMRLVIFPRRGLGQMERRRVLILGAGLVGEQVKAQIAAHPGFGLEFAGFLDDDPAKQHARKDVLGPVDSVRQVVTAAPGLDDVVVALPRSAYRRLNQVVAGLHDLPVRVWVIPDYFSLALHRAAVNEFAGMPMLDLRAPALSEYQRMVKRAFDLVVTLLVLPFALLLMAVIAVVIRLDSPGPVLYTPKRVGENGRLFTMFKFRTMVVNAEQMRHLVEQRDAEGRIIHKVANDPRITRVGRFLRKSSLDELPQVFNVLRGDMSLVGPRPEMPWLVELYEPWQRKRFAVPQGLTGWWQINGRSDRPMHLHTEDDLYYVQHYSIWLDLQILAKTVWVVLRKRGAF